MARDVTPSPSPPRRTDRRDSFSTGSATAVHSRDASKTRDGGKAGELEDSARKSKELQPASPASSPGPQGEHTQPNLTQTKKFFLLAIFSIAEYLDVSLTSALFLFTDAIALNLEIPYLSSTWVITAYVVTFASFLPFWGRVSDLFSAKPVFIIGFAGLGIANLILSFMTNRFAYFVFRALSGIFGAATIPSAYRLIPHVFEPHERNLALTIFGVTGALANATGLIVAGFFGFITVTDQNASWRWYFRMVMILITPLALICTKAIPHTTGDMASAGLSTREKIKRFDIIGTFLMLFAIILLIVGLTLGATYGYKTVKFLAPFLLAWPLFIGFFFWEGRLPEDEALIPPKFWSYPNLPLLSFIALGTFPIWSYPLLPFLQRWQTIDQQPTIIAAIRWLPSGIAGLILGSTVPLFIHRISARWTLIVSLLFDAAGMVILVFNRGNLGADYWRYIVPGLVVSSGANNITFLALNISIMASVPPSAHGCAGAVFQVCLQAGGVIGLSIQAGLFTVRPGNVADFYNVQLSLWFMAGWATLNALLALIFFRDQAVVNALPPSTGEMIAAGTVHDGTGPIISGSQSESGGDGPEAKNERAAESTMPPL